jgi:hypothetical protein
MPKRMRRPDAGTDPQHRAIVAGLRLEDCPPDGNRFTHHAAYYLVGRRSRVWPRAAAVFASLDRAERREIVKRRRLDRDAVRTAEMVRDNRAQLAAGTGGDPYLFDPRAVLRGPFLNGGAR